jgi:hypothetical protein
MHQAKGLFIDTGVETTEVFLILCSFFLQEIQFLDLTNADEEECNFLQTTLFSWNPSLNYPELPWATQSDSACTRAEWRPASYGK